MLRLMFMTCHPLLPREARVARTLSSARVPFDLPGPDERPARLSAVLEVIYHPSLARAQALAVPLGPYALQAAIAACHARAPRFAATDWAGSSRRSEPERAPLLARAHR